MNIKAFGYNREQDKYLAIDTDKNLIEITKEQSDNLLNQTQGQEVNIINMPNCIVYSLHKHQTAILE